MFPYADDTESYSAPIWVFILIAVNALVFLFTATGGMENYLQAIFTYGAIPWRFFHGSINMDTIAGLASGLKTRELIDANAVPPFVTLFTSMFLHGGFFHILGNVWFLWLFGDNVEDRMGKLIFPIFYIVCGLAAGFVHVVVYSSSTVPVVGASGAIAGVMGAYIYMFPRATIATFFTAFYFWSTIHIPASIYLGFWFVLQIFGGFAGPGVSNVAFLAHIGGFLTGLGLAALFAKSGLITWYPYDRGYQMVQRRVITKPPRIKRRYTWRD